MKSSKLARVRSRAFAQVTPVAAAVAAVLCAPGVAFAQSAPAASAQNDVVTITGIRRGIESAISVKKNAEGVVEAISAEDIGKLPDTSIAESLARLPGVTAQRDRNGNATNINIRGMGPDFNGYLLNGREQSSTTDSRGVDLSVYPAELIGGATVYKTTDATLMTAGLAGTLDTRLIDPLAQSGRTIAGSITRTKTSVGLPVTGKGNRFSLSYVDQFADRTLGVAIGFVGSKTDSSAIADGSWGNNASVTTTGGQTGTYNIPFGGGLSVETDIKKDERTGVAAILSYKPNKMFQTEVDLYSAKIKTALKKNALKGGTFNGAVTNATVAGGTVSGNTISGGTVTAGTFSMGADGLIVYSENLFDDDKIDSVGWKSTLKFGGGWTASADLNHNKAKRVEKDIEVYAGIATADTLRFSGYGGTGIPSLTVGNPGAYTNPATLQVRDQSGWSGVSYPTGSPYAGQTVPQAGYIKGPTLTDKVDALRFDLRKDLDGGMFTDVQFGLNFGKRSKDRISDEALIIANTPGGYGPNGQASPVARVTYPADAYVFNNVAGTGINVLTIDPTENLWSGVKLQPKFNNDILDKTWTVQEKVTTAYAKLNVDTSLAGVAVTGNVGAQLVKTDQSSGGYRSAATGSVTLNNPAGGLTTAGTTYTDVLPSMTLKGDLGSGNVLRFGLAKQLARPTLTDLRNSFNIGKNNQTNRLEASSGSPDLKPFKAWALDLSYEKYFGTKAYVSAAAFYKKLDTYITQSLLITDLSALAAQYGVTGYSNGGVGSYTKTVNGSGGSISGIELAASMPFNMISSWLEGFGATATYSNTSSNIALPYTIGLNPTQAPITGGITMQLPGLSKQNRSITLYYERAGFSAFVASSHRSTYIASVANNNIGGYPALAQIDPQTWVSAQVGYEFQSGPVKGLGVRFEGNNMNKPVYRDFNGTNTNSNETGAFYGFKLTYKLQ